MISKMDSIVLQTITLFSAGCAISLTSSAFELERQCKKLESIDLDSMNEKTVGIIGSWCQLKKDLQ